ncbi:MAG: Hsp20/alpha crystallin family protein [Elusimicrobiales bacterium]|nr:Hsp20/alpha crystallin family protein [Elusimicrobiales bacterium]
MRDLIKVSNELINIKKNMDKLFENFLKPSANITLREGENANNESYFTPPVNAIETDNELKIYVLIPFADKKDISLNIKEGILTIEGITKFELNEKIELLREEIPSGKFSRSFKIGVNIDSNKIKASYNNGILQIILPKKEESKANKIEIE